MASPLLLLLLLIAVASGDWLPPAPRKPGRCPFDAENLATHFPRVQGAVDNEATRAELARLEQRCPGGSVSAGRPCCPYTLPAAVSEWMDAGKAFPVSGDHSPFGGPCVEHPPAATAAWLHLLSVADVVSAADVMDGKTAVARGDVQLRAAWPAVDAAVDPDDMPAQHAVLGGMVDGTHWTEPFSYDQPWPPRVWFRPGINVYAVRNALRLPFGILMVSTDGGRFFERLGRGVATLDDVRSASSAVVVLKESLPLSGFGEMDADAQARNVSATLIKHVTVAVDGTCVASPRKLPSDESFQHFLYDSADMTMGSVIEMLRDPTCSNERTHVSFGIRAPAASYQGAAFGGHGRTDRVTFDTEAREATIFSGASTVFLGDKTAHVGSFPSCLVSAIRPFLMRGFGLEETPAGKRTLLFYVRRIHWARNLVNSDLVAADLWKWAERRGLELDVVYADDPLTTGERFARFARAQIVVMGHGGAMLNLIGLAPGATVIELTVDVCWALTIARCQTADYWPMPYGVQEESGGVSIWHSALFIGDMRMDRKLLGRIIHFLDERDGITARR